MLGIAPRTVGFTEWVFATELKVTTYFFALMEVKPQRWRPIVWSGLVKTYLKIILWAHRFLELIKELSSALLENQYISWHSLVYFIHVKMRRSVVLSKCKFIFNFSILYRISKLYIVSDYQ